MKSVDQCKFAKSIHVKYTYSNAVHISTFLLRRNRGAQITKIFRIKYGSKPTISSKTFYYLLLHLNLPLHNEHEISKHCHSINFTPPS
jgi:hypothetical protein